MCSLALICLHPSSLRCIEPGKLPNRNFSINLTPFPRCHAQGSQGVPRRTGPPVAGIEHRTTKGGRTRNPPGEWGRGPRPRGHAHPPAEATRPPGPRAAPPCLPPAGPKTAGAAAPVAAAAHSWRARAAAAAAAASTSPSGCLGRPRRACEAPARPPSRPLRRQPPQPQCPAPPERPTQPGPRGAARRVACYGAGLRRPPPPPGPARPAAGRAAAHARRPRPACACRLCVQPSDSSNQSRDRV